MVRIDHQLAHTVPAEAFCLECGYSLRGLEVCRCPECGAAFDLSQLSASMIPWHRRREIGYVRAFLKTVSAATFKPHLMALAAGDGVSRGAARLFAALVMVPVAAGLLLLLWVAGVQEIAGKPVAASPLLSWAAQLIWPLTIGCTIPGVIIVMGLYLAYALVVLPTRIARFWPSDVGCREAIISVAYYLPGAAFRGGMLGAEAGGMLGVLFLAVVGWSKSAALTATQIATVVAAFGSIVFWVRSVWRWHGQTRRLCGGVGPRLWIWWPVLLLLTGLSVLLIPFGAGLLYLINDSLLR